MNSFDIWMNIQNMSTLDKTSEKKHISSQPKKQMAFYSHECGLKYAFCRA